MDPKALVERFAEEVAHQTDAIWRGEAKTGNKHAKRYIEAFKTLRAMGDVGRDALCVLLRDERPDVRTMAAAYLLRYRTEEALQVLREEAAKGKSLTSFEAAQAIARWEDKTWSLDPP